MKIEKFERTMGLLPADEGLSKVFRDATVRRFKKKGKLTSDLVTGIFCTGFQSGLATGVERERAAASRAIEHIVDSCSSTFDAPMVDLADHVEVHGRTLVVHWTDGTVTAVRCAKGDRFDARTGFCIAYAKRALGGSGCAMKAALDSIPGMPGSEPVPKNKTEYEKALKAVGFDYENKIYLTKDGRHKVSRPIQKCSKDILDIYEALYQHYYPSSGHPEE